jgi:uncharacterized protein with PQ loop repeat
MINYLGYLASIIMLISMSMSSMKMFRYINSISCIMFVIYALLRNDTPIVILNIIVILINIYHLFFNKKINKI